MAKTLVVLVILIFILQSKVLILKSPPVWPDEAIYANIVNNFINEKRLAPDVWQEAYPAATKHFYSYPPVFFYLLTGWTKIFGFSAVAFRSFSLTLSAIFGIVFFFFAKLFFKGKNTTIFAILPLIALSIDHFFSQATRIARPEIAVTLFGTVSLLLFKKSFENKLAKSTKTLLLVGSAIFSSITFLTHFAGGFFALAIITAMVIEKRGGLFQKIKQLTLFILPFSILPAVWGLSLLKNFEQFLEQFLLFSKAVNGYTPFVFKLMAGEPFLQILLASYLLIFFTSVIYYLKYQEQKDYLPLILLIISAFTVIFGKELWYFIWVLPFIYLVGSILASKLISYHQEDSKLTICQFSTFAFGIALFINLALAVALIITYSGNKYSYYRLTEEVIRRIPPDKTVFLSSIPDPYFGLKEQRPHITIYEFPVVQIEKQKFLKILNDSDYVVYNGIHNKMAADLLPQYIEKNTLNKFDIGGNNQYRTSVIELLPRDQRVVP